MKDNAQSKQINKRQRRVKVGKAEAVRRGSRQAARSRSRHVQSLYSFSRARRRFPLRLAFQQVSVRDVSDYALHPARTNALLANGRHQ